MLASKLNNKSIWRYFFISKIIYMFLALFVYTRFASLGDTLAYLNGSHVDMSIFFRSSTNMIGVSAYLLAKVFGNILANIPFLMLAFYGIYYSVSRLILTRKELICLLLLLSLPSFSIWTSITSKESIGVFFMAIDMFVGGKPSSPSAETV